MGSSRKPLRRPERPCNGSSERIGEVEPKRHLAVYVRVSTSQQKHRSQLPDLKRWIEAYAGDAKVVFYRDKATGKSMDRPGWNKLQEALNAGKISKLIVWRLDRLGRTASGLTALFEELQAKQIGFVSIKDSVDLSTPAGRVLANVLASVATYETEIRGERVLAGQAAAKAKGKSWGGSIKGKRKKVTKTQERIIKSMKTQGEPIKSIADAVGLSRPTIYSVLNN